VQFTGSIDVCCTGAKIRCAMARVVPSSYLRGDVQIVPTTRSQPGPCQLQAMQKVQAAVGFRPTARVVSNEAPTDNRESAARMAGEMLNATFCLTPAGDTCVTSRLYTAIAAGCIPVVICDGLRGAFPSRAQYGSYWIKLAERDWIRDPESALQRLLEMPADEVARRQQQLRLHRADVLYDAEGSRVGAHVLEEAARCLARGRPLDHLSDRSRSGRAVKPADARGEAGGNRTWRSPGGNGDPARPGSSGRGLLERSADRRWRPLDGDGCNSLAQAVVGRASNGGSGDRGYGCGAHPGGTGGGVGGDDALRDAARAKHGSSVLAEVLGKLRAATPQT